MSQSISSSSTTSNTTGTTTSRSTSTDGSLDRDGIASEEVLDRYDRITHLSNRRFARPSRDRI
ncbi:hypothetical protein OG21DRAFT_1509751 [Imleria badia]|nr:hypothetical protein OG21DRAFT_1509751 [Imleria badia]